MKNKEEQKVIKEKKQERKERNQSRNQSRKVRKRKAVQEEVRRTESLFTASPRLQ